MTAKNLTTAKWLASIIITILVTVTGTAYAIGKSAAETKSDLYTKIDKNCEKISVMEKTVTASLVKNETIEDKVDSIQISLGEIKTDLRWIKEKIQEEKTVNF